jgi:DUF218 domain
VDSRTTLSRLIQRRTLWWPTLLGWVLIGVVIVTPLVWWWFKGEDFLSATHRLPAEVLVVDGWIGRQNLEAAKTEFERGGYTYVATTGGLSSDWNGNQWNHAQKATNLMIRFGVPPDRVIEAPARETKSQRTFESALAVRTALDARRLQPAAVNIFTVGAHAKRSRLVFAKTLAAGTRVGVISVTPIGYASGPWWKSTERADDFLKETIGWLYELLLNSGRTSNSDEFDRPAGLRR